MTATPGRILLVDDDPDVGDLVVSALEPEGYEVEVATSGAAALEKCREVAPNLLLVDLMLPKMDGEALLEALAESPAADIPVIVLSASHVRDEIVERFGCIASVGKPIQANQLRGVVQRAIPSASRDAAGPVHD